MEERKITVFVNPCPKCGKIESKAHYSDDLPSGLGKEDKHTMIVLHSECSDCMMRGHMEKIFMDNIRAQHPIFRMRHTPRWAGRTNDLEGLARAEEVSRAIGRKLQDHIRRVVVNETETMMAKSVNTEPFRREGSGQEPATDPSAPEGAPESDQQEDPSQDAES